MKKVLLVLVILSFFAVNTYGQVGKMTVGGNLVLALPMGTFGDLYSTGFGGTATFTYRVIPNLDLTGTLGYISFGYDVSNLDGSFSSVPFLVGGRYYFEAGSIKPYVGAELGLHFGSTSVDLPSFSAGGFSFGGGSQSASSTDFGFGFGGGVQVPVGDKLHVDGTLQYNLIATSGSSSGYISVEAGVAYGIN